MSYQPILHEKKYQEDCCCCYTKYARALRHLIPFRLTNRDKNLLPGNDAGLFSYITISWITSLMWKAYRHGLELKDLWTLQDEDEAESSNERIERLWEREKEEAKRKGREAKLWRVVWRFIRTQALIAYTLMFISYILIGIGSTVMLKLVLDYISVPEVDQSYGALICFGTFLSFFCKSFSRSGTYVIGTHAGVRLTGGLQAMIYKKILRLKTGGERLSANVVNICTADMERLLNLCTYSSQIAIVPLFYPVLVVFMPLFLGPWTLLGVLIFALLYPYLGYISRALAKLRKEAAKATDRRVEMMAEILNNMNLIKMYSWEDSFRKKIFALRGEELKYLRKTAVLQTLFITFLPSTSVVATIFTLLGKTLAGNTLYPSEAFTIYSMFFTMQIIVESLPISIRVCADSFVALGRIQKLLELPEETISEISMTNNLAVEIKAANFAWEIHDADDKENDGVGKKHKGEKDKKDISHHGSVSSVTALVMEDEVDPNKFVETLYGINLSVEHGKLIGVCGSVGSGKSSLIAAICGDMRSQHGSLNVGGQLALVTQQAWIYNDTFQENLLMGKKLEARRYKAVLWACSLETDISILPNGDMTEIGERGSNLSGGQKQRLNLARAVYSNSDIYLLDDPLSAVDTNVAQHIFNNCIKGLLASRTIILVTHATHFLKECDKIIVMKDGRIVEQGSHKKLMKNGGEYCDLVTRANVDDDNEQDKKTKQTKKSIQGYNEENNNNQASFGQEKGKLTTEETKASGDVSSRIYLALIKSIGGWGIASAIIFAFVVFVLTRLFNIIWLQYWLDQGDGRIEERLNATLSIDDDRIKGNITDNPLIWMYQLVYGLSIILLFATGISKGIGIMFRLLVGSTKLHHDMFESIMRAPMRFFDTTPSKRILNRFSRDMDELDIRVPLNLDMMLQSLLFLTGQAILSATVYPWFLIPFSIIVVVFIILDQIMTIGVFELKRLDNTLKSPFLQHITSSISGLSIIRTMKKEIIFIERMYKRLNKHSSAYLTYRLSSRWFMYRVELLGDLITVSMITICVFTKGYTSAANAGLAISSAYGATMFIPYLLRVKMEFVASILSLERIVEYSYDQASEAPREIPLTWPGRSWPWHGAIELHDVKLRYRPDLPLVLHGITAFIKPCEKIGIVGRTGAGKSSLISTLLRLCELDGGMVVVDGVDISTIGLHTLRSSISIIPQDPALFKGTIRFNIDPFDEHSDEEVWRALERSHLKATIKRLENELSSEVEAAGKNFSVGERQLICLTRALLRNSKILMLDEATASIDYETDALIQTTIREAFVRSTVLTIAHRLNTVASYDRILVLDAGMIKEFASPEDLMANKKSLFRNMMEAMGVTTVEQMKALV